MSNEKPNCSGSVQGGASFQAPSVDEVQDPDSCSSSSPARPRSAVENAPFLGGLGRLCIVVVVLLAGDVFGQEASADLTIVTVVGAGGEEEYIERFGETADNWRAAAAKGGAEYVEISGKKDNRESLEKWIAEQTVAEDGGEVWLVLIGHGSFDGRKVKFNMTGPDFTDEDLAGWLEDWKRPLALINGASSSSPFLISLSGPQRTVISATKSASEVFYTRFGEFFAKAIGGEEGADLDNDEQVSLLEAFLFASNEVAEFYESEGRLATEHALIDDNGDRRGTRAEWFEGVRAVRKASADAEPDGERALQRVLIPNAAEARMAPELRKTRDALELELNDLRRNKGEMEEAAYYDALEEILLQIAEIYRKAEEGDS